MPNNSMQQLSEKLSEKQVADAARFESQTQIALKEHASALRQLSADALKETRDAIESGTGELEATLESHRLALKRMAKELRTIHEAEARRMRWILRVPLLIVILTTVIAMAGIWGWWRYQRPWSLVPMSNGQRYQVLKGNWTTTMCKVEGKQRPCRPTPGGND